MLKDTAGSKSWALIGEVLASDVLGHIISVPKPAVSASNGS